MSKIIRKADLILFVILLLLGVGLSVLSYAAGSGNARTVVITVAGEVYGTYDLAEDREILIERDGHTNKVIINQGHVQMESANCHNQLCVNRGQITKAGEAIIGLPNRVVVRITGKEADVDVYSG